MWTETFFDQVLADIFDKNTASWSYVKLFLLKALYDTVAKLEKHIVLTTTIEHISEAVEMMWDVGVC